MSIKSIFSEHVPIYVSDSAFRLKDVKIALDNNQSPSLHLPANDISSDGAESKDMEVTRLAAPSDASQRLSHLHCAMPTLEEAQTPSPPPHGQEEINPSNTGLENFSFGSASNDKQGFFASRPGIMRGNTINIPSATSPQPSLIKIPSTSSLRIKQDPESSTQPVARSNSFKKGKRQLGNKIDAWWSTVKSNFLSPALGSSRKQRSEISPHQSPMDEGDVTNNLGQQAFITSTSPLNSSGIGLGFGPLSTDSRLSSPPESAREMDMDSETAGLHLAPAAQIFSTSPLPMTIQQDQPDQLSMPDSVDLQNISRVQHAGKRLSLSLGQGPILSTNTLGLSADNKQSHHGHLPPLQEQSSGGHDGQSGLRQCSESIKIHDDIAPLTDLGTPSQKFTSQNAITTPSQVHNTNAFSLNTVRRHIRHQLESQKAATDRELGKIIIAINQHIDVLVDDIAVDVDTDYEHSENEAGSLRHEKQCKSSSVKST